MTTAAAPGRAGHRRAVVAAALVTALAIAAVALAWSKWVPYLHKAVTLSGTHTWKGSSILAVGGVHASNAPSWHAATSFASAYFELVWRALVAALLISAAVSAFVPGSWVARVMNRRTKVGSAAVGGLMSTPSLMCTCCTAPVAATLRREGAGTAAVVAYWLGNPLLNPAVLVFLGFVAPWQWVVTRLAVGLVVVVGGSALVGRLVERDAEQRPAAVPADASRPVDGTWLAGAPRRFVLTLLRLGLILVPEYLVVVLAVGAVRGWLFPVGESGFVHAGVLVVIVAAVVGTLVVIPTGGEIPIVAGLAALGLSLGGVGALLLTLPAVSLPAMAMLVRSLGRRAVGAAAGVVALGGVLAGGLLTALG